MKEKLLRLVAGSVLLAFIALPSTGCRTYFGYEDVFEEDDEEISSVTIKNSEYYIPLTVSSAGEAKLSCIHQWEEHSTKTVKQYIAGKEEYYSDFNGAFWFENEVINPLQSYDSRIAKTYESSMLKFFWDNFPPAVFILYPIALPIECLETIDPNKSGRFPGWAFTVPTDLVVYSCGFCWTMIAGPSHWFGGRLFWWMTDWQLRTHEPNFLRQFTYLPLVNLFFPFQTPPYMVQEKDIKTERIEYPKEDWEHIATRVTPRVKKKEEICADHTVTVELISAVDDSNVYKKAEFISGYDGGIDLTGFLQGVIRNGDLPAGVDHFKMKVQMKVQSEFTVTRIISGLTRDMFMEEEALKAKKQYETTGNFSEKMLLRKKYHKIWGMKDQFEDETFRNLDERVKAETKKK